ncbi:hypothetical protein RND81_14G038800 [Saponaria officinalis]|uniref:J domain-containing protein n=1 Tax=Saponaria officinalis TaxID=3572 RepID=A0AAW1GLK2_SAPOF
MSPPAASVDTRATSDPNFDFNFNLPTQNGNPNFERCSFNSGASSSHYSVNKSNQSSSSSARPGPRVRPRLVKQRRSCKTTSSSAVDVGDSGINPFRSVCSSNNSSDNNSSDNNVVDGQFGNVSFVFGVSNSNDRASDCNSSKFNNGNNIRNVDAQLKNAGFVFMDSNKGDDCDSTKNSNNVRNGADVIAAQFNKAGFVFGRSNLNNKGGDCNVSNNVTEAAAEGSDLGNDTGNGYSMNNVSVEKQGFIFTEKVGEFGSKGVKHENGGVEGVAFNFSATVSDHVDDGDGKYGENGAEFGLSEELKKLNIERNGRGGFGGEKAEVKSNVGVSSGVDQFFVFTSGGMSSDKSEASAIHLNGDDKNANDEETSGIGHNLANDNVFVFRSSGNPTGDGGSISQPSSFSAEVDGGRVKDVLRSLFSSSVLGAEVDSGKPEACSVSDEKKADCSVEGVTESSATSFPEFKLPGFDVPLSFSSNLLNESGRKAEPRVRARGLRDKHIKKTKSKAKHSKSTKQQHVEIPSAANSVSQAQETAECYSPMDFSPYEETTATNDTPVICQEVTGQSNQFMENGLGATMAHPSPSFSANVNKIDDKDVPFALNSDESSEGQEKFASSASVSAQNDISSQQRQQKKKKYRMKSASVAGTTSMARGSSLSGTTLSNKLDGLSGNSAASASMSKHETKGNREQSGESEFSSAEKACDKWRRRGNEAYEKGDLSKAEDFYTFGVNSIPPGNTSDTVFTPLVRCYSNRAATRMALGRVREAVQDCLMAVKLDPTFHRAHTRAANCYLQLGELEDAMKCFGNIIESSTAVCLDRQVFKTASEGIRKSQKVIECTDRSAELLRLKTSEAAASALELIVEAMSTSIHSEKLLEMKAEALCMLRRHDEAIALCNQTRDFAKKNFTTASFGNHEADGSCSNIQRWRQRALYKCYFHLGKLETALDYSIKEESGARTQESSDPLAVTIGELLREKSAGNTAFQSGKHTEAIEHYTTAILSSMESRPFAAICFCNRAAAQQALGHIADAISDCSLAIALDENYAKAVSRRATLHEMIRDYKQAAIDLQRFISLLEKQSVGKSKQSGSANGKDLKQVRHRLSVMEEEAKRGIPLDLYLILGVNKSDPASEIKKAYRKAALRHHPDKAGQSLVRSDAGDEGRHWKDIAELVHKDSDRLFKMIGEAYAVLSDPTKVPLLSSIYSSAPENLIACILVGVFSP